MDVLAFSCEGLPRGKGRPRFVRQRGYVSTYTDSRTVEYESSIRDIAKRAMGDQAPFTGPLSLSIRLRLQVPTSYARYKRERMLSGEEPYFGVIDWDNGAKSVCDAMNGVVFVDDRQIVRAFVVKEANINPGVDIRVECLAPQTRPASSPLSAAAEHESPQIVSTREQGVFAHLDGGQAAQ